jgi:uncharacterized membrane protein
MTNRLLGIALVVAGAIATAATGCGDDTSSTGDGAECDSITVKGYAELQNTAFARCTNCHSSQLSGSARNAAPEGSDYDTYDGAKQQVEAKAPRDLVSRVEDNTMPFAGYPQFQGTEKEDMLNWAKCGTPP